MLAYLRELYLTAAQHLLSAVHAAIAAFRKLR